ncbi:hypothetical protein [Candidatus Marithrix sp. Canyon 246]|nr:hypothetical protein [Candidatus Marithrix sp. Canyon 246]
MESENDKYFVETLIEHWQYANITLNSPILVVYYSFIITTRLLPVLREES